MVVGLAACGDDDDDGTAATGGEGENALTITERDYAFDVEGEATAGTLTIDVTNNGKELHELAMARLVDGKSLDDARSALESADPEDEDSLKGIIEEEAVIDELGGVQLPGTSYAITGSGIEAGDYVLMCFIPNAEGKPHFSLGMLTGFTIGEGEGGEASDADVTYTASDDGLDGPETVDAGETTIEVVNDTSVNREISLIKVKDGKTMDDVGMWFEAADQGPPDVASAPLEFLAFIFDAEQDRTITVDLTPGQWAIQSADPEKPFEGPPTEDPHAILFMVE
jgi:hypothetical protein